MVDQHAEPSARYGTGLGDPAGQVVDPCSGSTTTPSTRRSCSLTRSTSSASWSALHLQQAVPRGAGDVAGDAGRAGRGHLGLLRSRPGGAQRRGELHVNTDGTIGHAEVGIGDAVLMFAEASDLWPDVPVRAPDSPATFSHTLHLEVDDVDASTERARRSGASVEREPVDQPYGRGSVIVDPFGTAGCCSGGRPGPPGCARATSRT